MEQATQERITSFIIDDAVFPEHATHVAALFREYEASLGISLCFQSFEQEMANLPGAYAAPGGGLYLAWYHNLPVGCVAFRPITAHTKTCELKRLFVRPEAAGMGIGRCLLAHAMQRAKLVGYNTMWLDTLTRLTPAMQLYRHAGFVPIVPYNTTDLPDICYLGTIL